MNLLDYIEKAKQKHEYTSYRELGRALELKSETSIVNMRNGKQLPSDETMIRLAELAGEPAEVALLRLNIWRSKSPTAKERYTQMAESMAKQASAWLICTATAAIIMGMPAGNNAYAAENFTGTNQHQYYGGYKLCNNKMAVRRCV